MLHRFFSLLFMACLALSLGACAGGNKYELAGAAPQISSHGKGLVSVAAHDQRPYVLSGRKKPLFIGLHRGVFGIPLDVITKSEQPLADDLVKVLTAALSQAGYSATPVVFEHMHSPGEVTKALLAKRADRAVLLKVNEWRSDVSFNVRLFYDLQLQIFDRKGKVITQKQVKGDENLGGNAWNPTAYAMQVVPGALTRILKNILEAPEIQDALAK
jgi:hypothetical protein